MLQLVWLCRFFDNERTHPKLCFSSPGGVVIAGLSLVLIVWLLANSTGQEAITAAFVAAVGLLISLRPPILFALFINHSTVDNGKLTFTFSISFDQS